MRVRGLSFPSSPVRTHLNYWLLRSMWLFCRTQRNGGAQKVERMAKKFSWVPALFLHRLVVITIDCMKEPCPRLIAISALYLWQETRDKKEKLPTAGVGISHGFLLSQIDSLTRGGKTLMLKWKRPVQYACRLISPFHFLSSWKAQKEDCFILLIEMLFLCFTSPPPKWMFYLFRLSEVLTPPSKMETFLISKHLSEADLTG